MLGTMDLAVSPLMTTHLRLRRMAFVVSGGLALLAAAMSPAQAEPQQALALLLKHLNAKPIGLYDGVRFFHLTQPGGGILTLTVSCEREQWRVQSSGSSFYDAPFLSAKGIARTWVCTTPARVME
jgi:hypothetical protein